MANHSHLWNDLPFEERNRLYPHMLESQILHLEQSRELLVRHHKQTLAELDKWIGNLRAQTSFNEAPKDGD